MGSPEPGQWTVEEVLPNDAEVKGSCLKGVGRLVRITASGTYNPDEWWPKVGQRLAVKETSK